MSASEDNIADLRNRITRIVRESTGMHERLALPIAAAILDELQVEHGGTELYIPIPSREQRNAEIIDAWRCGMSIPDIAKARGYHIATIYRILASRKSERHK